MEQSPGLMPGKVYNDRFTQRCSFAGEQDNPMLAPRGVFMHGSTLVASDTGKNRLFIWKDFNYATHQQATVVIGQQEHGDSGRNAGAAASASTLQYPSGIWTNGVLLIVADAWNHRVLIWHSLPTQNGQPADVVVGQPDFAGNQPNITGLGAAPSARSLYWPYSVWSDGRSLWVADTGNRRVLYYEHIPTANFAPADKVVGQVSMEEKDYDNNNAIWPYSVKVGHNGELAIADTQYYRVLLWHKWQDAFRQPADVLIGQPTMDSNGQNQYRLKPTAATMNWCYDLCFYKNGICVADTGNSRVTIWDKLPRHNNEEATTLIGQPDFGINGESSLSMKTTLANEIYWPFAVNTIGNDILIADTGNHRILIYKPQTP